MPPSQHKDKAPHFRYHGLQLLLVFLFLPPILVVGYIVNLPTAGILLGVCKVFAKDRKDEATIKILLGSVLFPLTWIGVGMLAAQLHQWLHDSYPSIPNEPVLAGLTVMGLGMIGGLLAIRYMRFARETMRAVRFRVLKFAPTRVTLSTRPNSQMR